MIDQLSWGSAELGFRFEWDAVSPVRITQVTRGGEEFPVYAVPLVEILTTDTGRLPASDRLAHTELGSRLRYVDHTDGVGSLEILQAGAGVEATITVQMLDGAPAALRSTVTVRATGPEPLVLRSVASWSAGFTARNGSTLEKLDGWERISGTSDWLGEGRWSREPLRGPDFPHLAEGLTGHNPRGAWAVTSDGTWSTGRDLPIGGIQSTTAGIASVWQIEHNGAWRWELGEDTDGGYYSLSGPTDIDSAWTRVLEPGESFTTVPVTVAVAATSRTPSRRSPISDVRPVEATPTTPTCRSSSTTT